MRLLAFACLMLFATACTANCRKHLNFSVANIDTSKYALIKFVKERDHYHFDGNFAPTTLTAAEIKKVDELFKKAVGKHAKESKYFPQSAKRYHVQVIAAINPSGEKVVWLNCFCGTTKEYPAWKTEPLIVLDGGPCYFNFNINLATGKDYNFSVNGVA